MNDRIYDVTTILHKTGAINLGNYTLSSGKTTTYYIDMRVVPSHPEEFRWLMNIQIEHMKTIYSNRMHHGYAGVPVSGVVYGSVAAYKLEMPFMFVRGGRKAHGLKKTIEVWDDLYGNIIVIDDTITDGKSKVGVIETLRKEGFNVFDVYVTVDREEGGAETLSEIGVRLSSLVTASEIFRVYGDVCRNERRIQVRE